MLKDLERFGSEITALALAPVTAQLKTVNDEFQQTYAARQAKAVDQNYLAGPGGAGRRARVKG